MLIIGESIHVISKQVSEAIEHRTADHIQTLAREQAEGGADYIDINLGPARVNPEATMEWLVDTVQSVTDLPLSLDTMNAVAMNAGLKICKKTPLLNSVSGRTDSKERMLPLAVKYGCDVVISVLTDRGCPPDIDSRVESIMETVATANEMGIPNEKIWVDPILLPVSADQPQLKLCLEFVGLLPDLLPGAKSTIGLSNISNGTPRPLRAILNRTYMVMLQRSGLYSAIADALDPELMSLNRGGMPEVVDLIHRTMDGKDIDEGRLTESERDYLKTARVLLGEVLYSHAWMET
jgi:5-methyltetrahydrofolate corrinoid/iron sulfur protein methyltransferase